MKNIILMVLFLLTSFSKCDTSLIKKEPPSKILDAYFQNWVGGKPESEGILLTVLVENSTQSIVFDSIYFNNKREKINTDNKDDKLILTGNFIKDLFNNKDLILSSDSKEEFGNTPPKFEKESSFKLGQNQAIISYIKSGKTHYFLVENIRKEKTITYQ